MKKYLLLAILTSFCMANDEYDGAFGIKFGEKLSNLKVLRSNPSKNFYKVKAPKPNFIDTYIVIATAKSKEVAMITGLKEYNSPKLCSKAKNKLIKDYEKLYEKKALFNNENKIAELEFDNMFIKISCENPDTLLVVTYTNFAMALKAMKEEK